MTRSAIARIVALAVAGVFLAAAPAHAQLKQIGTLTCANVVQGFPLFPIHLVRRQPVFRCIFDPISSLLDNEVYRVTVLEPHPQILADETVTLVWKVFAAAKGSGLLAGGYAPASDGDPVEEQLGAPLLVGGFGNLIALDPAGEVVGHQLLSAKITVLELEFLP